MTEEQIKHLRDRFLGWKLPEDFSPDAGIKYTPPHGCWSTPPSGTNLFDATQADAMVRYMIDGMPADTKPQIKPKPLKKNQIKALKELGEPGHFRVNWRPNLSPDAYRDLKDRALIQEAWTWASTTRPDVAITEAGVAARAG